MAASGARSPAGRLSANKPRLQARAASERAAIAAFVTRWKDAVTYLRSGSKDNLPLHNSRRKLAHGTGVFPSEKRNSPQRAHRTQRRNGRRGLTGCRDLQYILNKQKQREEGKIEMSGHATQYTLTPVAQKFILHWGEMGTRWGINRTVAQVHALLFVAPKPLPADEISTTLAVARSNVSTSLRELQGWGIVRVVHVLGDRRDHFESIKDVWEIFRIVSEERKRREIDPTLR